LCRKNLSVLMPLWKNEAGLSTEWLAQAVFLFSAGYAAGQLFLGMAADALGARRVAAAGMLASAALTAAMGFLHSPWLLLCLQAGNGMAQAAGWPALVKLISAHFGREQRGVAMAWWCSNYVAGAFFATLFATFAATGPVLSALGWRRGVWAPALLLGLMALVFLRWAPETARASAGQTGSTLLRLRDVFGNARIRTIACAYFFIKLSRYAMLFWLPLFMVERLGYSAEEAGYTSSVYELAGFGGVLLAGYVSDRLFSGRRFPVAALSLGALAMVCVFFPAASGLHHAGNWLGIALLGVLTFGPDTLLSGAATQDEARRDTAASAAGLVNAVGSAGQLMSPLLVSAAASRWGWDAVFYLLMACALTAAFLVTSRWTAAPAPAVAQQEA
jgi:OPA family sugar phosphate sensor protein UhpC-like MFS transporter